MANTIKEESEKKKVMSVSIKQKHLQEFRDICDDLKIVPSNKVEELIINFNKSK